MNKAVPKAQADIIGSLDSIINTNEATISDIGKKFKEIPSDLIFDFRDIGRVSDIRRQILGDYEQRIAKCKELKDYVINPPAEEAMALAVADVNEYVRQTGSNKHFKFLPIKPPASFIEKKMRPLLDSTFSHFQTAMAGLQAIDDINRFYQNALDKLTSDLASVAGKRLSEDKRRRQQVFYWTVFLNTLNEYGKVAFASKQPNS